MKICLVTPYFTPARGGVETYTLQIATHLRDTYKHNIFVVTTKPGPGPVHIEERAGFKTYTLPTNVKLSNTPIGFTWHKKLSSIFASEQPDVINAHTPVPFLADMAERVRGQIPFVLTVHNDIEKSTALGKLIATIYYHILGNQTLEHSDSIVATSDYYVDTSRRLSAQRSKLHIATCGVDTTLFHPSDPASNDMQVGYTGRQIILFVGTMDTTHTRALAQLRELHENILLLAVGKGDAIPKYQKMANDLDLKDHILFTGPVENTELAKCYRMANVCVLPSTNRSEGLGLVLIEASASQIPIIGTNVGGIPCAVLDNKTGLLVEPADVQALTGAIERILSDSALATSLGTNGLRHVKEHFTWEVSAEAMNNVLVHTVYDHRKGN